MLRIESLYKNNGFINVKVSDPQIEMEEESITIGFRIDEGEQYKTGTVDITGDILTSKADLSDKLLVKESDLYNRELIRKDMLGLNDYYANQGFANVKVSPLVETDDARHIVNITYHIVQGEPVYFNRILISGNKKTRDKVIGGSLPWKSRENFHERHSAFLPEPGLQRLFSNGRNQPGSNR